MEPLEGGKIQVFMTMGKVVNEEIWEFSNGENRLSRKVFHRPPDSLSEYLYYVDSATSASGAGLRFIE